MENHEPNRRNFIRKIVSVTALAGITGALLGRVSEKDVIPRVQAADNNALLIGNPNFGTNTTSLTSSSSNRVFFVNSTGGGPAFEGSTNASNQFGVLAKSGAQGVVGITQGVAEPSAQQIGVHGIAHDGAGVVGNSDNGAGVFGQSNGPDAWGVLGRAVRTPPDATGSGIGVFGESSWPDSAGVVGFTNASSGEHYGVVGSSNQTGVLGAGDSTGVKGRSDSGWGVWGDSLTRQGVVGSTEGIGAVSGKVGVQGVAYSGIGVKGLSITGTGVYGIGDATTGPNIGVYGSSSSSSGVGVLAEAGATGTIPIVAKARAGQTANLQEWRSGSGTNLAMVDKSGNFGIGIQPTAPFHIKAAIPIFRFTGTSLPGNQWHFGRFDQSNRFTIAETGVGDYLTILGTSGNVGIGNINPAFKLDVNGQCHATSFPTSSDMRFKEDIAPIDGALDKVLRLNGVYFRWNHLHRDVLKRSSTTDRQVGLIAQQVQQVIPEIVCNWGDEGADDYLAVDYSRLIAVVIEAIKELAAQNMTLREQNDDLQARLTRLEQSTTTTAEN